MTLDDLRNDFRQTSDGDGFGNCMAWLFACAIELDIRGDDVPEAWQYRAGAAGSHHEPDCYYAECLSTFDSDTIAEFGNILSRYQSKLHAAGKTY